MRSFSRARNIIVRVATSVRPRASAISRPLKPWAAMRSAARASAGSWPSPSSRAAFSSRRRISMSAGGASVLARETRRNLLDGRDPAASAHRQVAAHAEQPGAHVVGRAAGLEFLDEPQERLLDEVVGDVPIARHRVGKRGQLLLMLLERLDDIGRFRRLRPGTVKRPQRRLGRVRQDGVIPHPRTTFDDSSCYPGPLGVLATAAGGNWGREGREGALRGIIVLAAAPRVRRFAHRRVQRGRQPTDLAIVAACPFPCPTSGFGRCWPPTLQPPRR